MIARNRFTRYCNAIADVNMDLPVPLLVVTVYIGHIHTPMRNGTIQFYSCQDRYKTHQIASFAADTLDLLTRQRAKT